MLLDVLTRVAADTGYEPTQQRQALLNLLNTGASELYNMLECNKIYRETTLVVPPDSVVALPSFVGELRGMRMHTNELPFDLAALSKPRYVDTSLSFKFKNWRDKGESPVCALPENIGQLTFIVPDVEQTPVTLLIQGQTNKAARLQEEVLIDAEQTTTLNMFGPNIYKIACASKRTCDITVEDSDGNTIAVLYNTDAKTRYKLVDVSQVFWTLDTSDGGSLIDVLYKIPYYRLTDDSDSFFAGDDFDNAWYSMCMHFFLRPMQGRQEEAQQAKADAVTFANTAKDSGEQQIIKKASYGRNKFYGIFRKYRYYPGAVTSVDHNVQT
jgi:hypothetical protein